MSKLKNSVRIVLLVLLMMIFAIPLNGCEYKEVKKIEATGLSSHSKYESGSGFKAKESYLIELFAGVTITVTFGDNSTLTATGWKDFKEKDISVSGYNIYVDGTYNVKANYKGGKSWTIGTLIIGGSPTEPPEEEPSTEPPEEEPSTV